MKNSEFQIGTVFRERGGNDQLSPVSTSLVVSRGCSPLPTKPGARAAHRPHVEKLSPVSYPKCSVILVPTKHKALD